MSLLRLATFNIQHGRRPDGVVDTDLVAATCAGLGADVLGLQELDIGVDRSGGVDQLAVVAAATGMAAAFAPALSIGRRGRYGNVLLVRGTLTDVAVVPLASPPGREPRSAIVARAVTTAGPALSVAVTHLSFESGGAGDQLPVVLAALRERPGPHVLMGDMNQPPRTVWRLTGPEGFELAAGPATFPARRPRRRIDHVAVRGLEIGDVRVERTPVSDHRPLVVDVREPPHS